MSSTLNDIRIPAKADARRRDFASRCGCLGLILWWVRDDAGDVQLMDSLDSMPEEVRRLFTSFHVLGQVREIAQQTDVMPRAEQPGALHDRGWCRFFALPEGRIGKRRGTCVIALPGQPDEDEVRAICELTDSPVDSILDFLQTHNPRTPREEDQLLTLLSGMHTDTCRAREQQSALDDLSLRLTEAYEELGFMYRLAGSMRGLGDPDMFISRICAELVDTLPFRWVTVVFNSQQSLPENLRARTLSSGTLDVNDDRFRSRAQQSLAALKEPRWTLIEPGDADSIANLVGSQVVLHPIRREQKVIGAIFCGNKPGPDPEVSSFELQLLDAAADFIGVFIENTGLYEEQHRLFIGTVEALSAAVDAKDAYTHGHSERVAHLAHRLALACGLDEIEAEHVRVAGLLHDIGKIGVSDVVLTKTGDLSEDETDEIRRHPEIGHRILKDVPPLQHSLPGVLHHHERWDGQGYPQALSGTNIPLQARILAIADSFDAMSSTRAYRDAMPRDIIMKELRQHAGMQFDPDLVQRFVDIDFREYDRLLLRHAGLKRAS